jgi:predicted RNA methylase
MFSFTGDTMLDPFAGTGTTLLAAANAGRNAIGVELDPDYARMAALRLKGEAGSLFQNIQLKFLRSETLDTAVVREETEGIRLPARPQQKPITYPASKRRKTKTSSKLNT